MDAKGFATSARLITLTLALFFFLPSAQAQDRRIPPIGGTGGGAFTARCPAGQILGGVELRVGDDVDAIRPLCRTASADVEKVYLGPGAQLADPYLYRDVVTYAVSEAIATSDWVGGSGGGGIRRVDCDVTAPGQPGETPSQYADRMRRAGTPGGVTRKVVTGMYVEAEGVDVVVVNSVTLLCGYFPPYQTNYGRSRDFRTKPDVETSQQTLEGPRYNEVHTGAFDSRAVEGSGRSVCAATISGSNATVAVGIHGRAGKWLDALGVICEDPKSLVAVSPVAEAQLSPGTPRNPVLTICEAAQQARARNSPAAPGLGERCVNPEPVKSVDRVLPLIGGPSGTIFTICEAALKARERDSPTAPGLEKRCRESNAGKPAARVSPPDGTTAKTTLTKCEAAKVARARNSPAAPGLEAQCAAQLANEASSVASSADAIASQGRNDRKAGLQRSVAEQNRRQKEIAAELAKNQDESAIGKIGNLITGGDPQSSGVATAVQKQGAGGTARRVAPAFQTENTIAVRVRYPKDYGFKADTSALGAAGPASCGVFSVSAAVRNGFTRQRNPLPVSTNSKLEDAGDYHVCNYIVSQVPLDKTIAVSVAIRGSDLSSPWVGGVDTEPPPGQQRTVVDASRTATLNSSQPRARLSFEMIYAPIPAR